MLKRSPLEAAHQKLGARLVEFGGWEMPLFYTSIVDEHQCVRSAAGLFDISHMGEFFVRGPQAEVFLNHVLTNDLRKIRLHQAQYTLLCNERGGVIDDLYAYQVEAEGYLLVVNASRIGADFAWLQSQRIQFPGKDQFELTDDSARRAALALQGPRAAQIIDLVFPAAHLESAGITPCSRLKKNEVVAIPITAGGGGNALVSRTGYTGEDGFELILPVELAEMVWARLLQTGTPFGLKPAGLGARDTLRTEMCYPLYGHELDENTTPLEAGLGYFVALEKPEFIAKNILASQKLAGLRKKLVAFKMQGKSAPPRPGYRIWAPGSEGGPLGSVSSGTQSPSLNSGVGLGYVPADQARPGTLIEIEIRGQRCPAEIVSKPIYKPRTV